MGMAKRKAATKNHLATLCFFKKCLPKIYIPTIGPKKAKAIMVIKNIMLIFVVSIRKVTQNRRDTGYNQRKTSSAKSKLPLPILQFRASNLWQLREKESNKI